MTGGDGDGCLAGRLQQQNARHMVVGPGEQRRMPGVEPQLPDVVPRARRQYDIEFIGPAHHGRCNGGQEGYRGADHVLPPVPDPAVRLGRGAADPAAATGEDGAEAVQEQLDVHGVDAPDAPPDPGAGHVHRDVPGLLSQEQLIGLGDVCQFPHHELIPHRDTERRVAQQHRRLAHGLRDQQRVLVTARYGREEAVRPRPTGRYRELGLGLPGPAGGEDVLGVGPVDQLPQEVRLRLSSLRRRTVGSWTFAEICGPDAFDGGRSAVRGELNHESSSQRIHTGRAGRPRSKILTVRFSYPAISQWR